MVPSPLKQISNPYSTGGGGAHFECQVQACFSALMLAGGYAPCIANRQIRKLLLQAKVHGYQTDDLVVVTSLADGTGERKLLAQVKHFVSVTNSDTVFGEVVQAAWADFNNPTLFSPNTDVLALISGPLSATDTEDARKLLEWARNSASPEEFFDKVETARFSSDAKRAKLQVLRHHVDAAAGNAVSNDTLFDFLRAFHLLGYDLDVRLGVVHSLVRSLVKGRSADDAAAVWAQLVEEMTYANQNAATVTPDLFSDELRAAFAPSRGQGMPQELVDKVAPAQPASWTAPPLAESLLAANLVGAWSERLAGDKSIVAQLAGSAYTEWIRAIREVLQLTESPLTQIAGKWTVVDRKVVWEALGSRIFDEHLEALRTCSDLVFKERDPQFDLEPDNRMAATLHGKVPNHSRELRRGLGETVALLGSDPSPLVNCTSTLPASTSAMIVRAALEGADWQLWGSLNELLPLFAEGAPEEFLTAVEQALQSDPCPFDELFKQEAGGIAGHNSLTGLLWALETAAWDEQLLVRSAVALAGLAARDPGGQWANRPANSLTNLFLPWLPQTLAPRDKQVVAVQAVIAEFPEVGWRLLLSLLPATSSISMGTRRPIWWMSLPESDPRPTAQEYWQQVSEYAALAVSAASNSIARLQELVDDLDRLPQPAADRVLELVAGLDRATTAQEQVTALWRTLTSLTRKHRRYSDSRWALPGGRVSEIEAVAQRIEPLPAEVRHRSLFSQSDWELYEDTGDWQSQQEQLNHRRVDAVSEILEDLGIVGVVEFATKTESPYKVGYATAMTGTIDTVRQVLPQYLGSADPLRGQFVSGFVSGWYRREEWDWVDSLSIPEWSVTERAHLLLALPFTEGSWDRVEAHLGGHTGEYWGQVAVNPYQAEGNLGIAVDRLLTHGRPRAAVDCIACMVGRNEPIDAKLAVGALLAAVSSQEPMNSLQIYSVTEVIEHLQNDQNADPHDLYSIEWAYLSLLNERHGAESKFLNARMATDPEAFMEIIGAVFRSEKAAQPETESSKEQQRWAELAYRLLHEWQTVPGTALNGTFSAEAFSDWVESVRKLAVASGHEKVAFHKAGEVLVHSPADPDGLWVHRGIATMLNRADMAELRRGFVIGILNSRGAFWVDPSGNAERELAENYERKADEAENAGFHRVGASVREVANTHRREATRRIAGEDD